jgi:hypothetical protein
VRADAQAQAAQHGAAANTSISYDYDIGPDGQLYVSSATVSSSTRSRERAGELTALRGQDSGGAADALQVFLQLREAKPGDFAPVKAQLSPSDEATVFGSEEFLNEIAQSDEAARRDRLQLADFSVRAQERQHYNAAAGLGSAPVYDYEVGPDGELYAVAGSVSILQGPAGSEEEAARDAATVGRAALAATDVSAQDIATARDAQSRAAHLYAINSNLQYNAYRQVDLAA